MLQYQIESCELAMLTLGIVAIFVNRWLRRLSARGFQTLVRLGQRARLLARKYVIRAIRCDFLPCFRMFQAAWRLSLSSGCRTHLLQLWVHATWVFLARFRRTNFIARTGGTLLRVLLIRAPLTLLQKLNPSCPSPLTASHTYLVAHLSYSLHVLHHLTHRNYVQLLHLKMDSVNGGSFCVYTIAILILVLFVHWVTHCYAHAFSRRGRNIMYRDFYECGFRAVPDIRALLDIQFSAVGIIFLVFDMEIVLLTPLLLNVTQLPMHNVLLILLIIGILGASYWFEWEKYTLQWSVM